MSVASQFYSDQAKACALSAASSRLPNQRETFLRAEAAWQAMADRAQRVSTEREQREADKVVPQ